MNCKIIQDLLPLYCDRVCSEESAQLVEEHLADCGDCTALLAELRKGPAPKRHRRRRRRTRGSRADFRRSAADSL